MRTGAKDLTLFDKIMGGGLLAGKKTYLAALGFAILAVINYLSGDLDAMGLIERLVGAFAAGGMRAGIAKSGIQCALPATAAALFLGLMLAGCASMDAETPKQRYAAALVDYNAALTAMVGYRDACAATPDSLPGDCVQHVLELRRLDGIAAAALSSAGDAVKAGGSNSFALISASISAIAGIGAYLVKTGVAGDIALERASSSADPPPIIAAFGFRTSGAMSWA